MKHRWPACLLFAAGALSLSLLLPACATKQRYAMPVVQTHAASAYHGQNDADSAVARLRVMTLNVAHGRGTAFHQLLQHSGKTRTNLGSIGQLLQATAPDIIALQEIDAPSFWSGGFNHLDYLAGTGVFTHSVQALHVDGLGLAYGTALMSRLGLSDAQAVTFDTSLSPVPKGFVVSTIAWPAGTGAGIDVVSVHLDFISAAVRKRQADELIAILRARNNHVIVMGDLNSGWHQQDSVARYLAKELALTAFEPHDRELVTFPALEQRLDWILVSSGFEFHSHEVIDAGVSDHRGVVAELVLSNP